MIYLDYAGSGIVRPEIAARYPEYCTRFSINPHGGTKQAETCRRAILDAERRILACLRIPEDTAHVIWTSGGTESLNLAILGCETRTPGALLLDDTAHHAMVQAALWRAQRDGTALVHLPVDGTGQLVMPPGAADTAAAVCVCHVNNETGARQNLTAIRRAVGEKALLIVDGAQSAGKIPMDWLAAHVDALTLSSRKIGGPASGGALVVRKGIGIAPMLAGGGQQGGIRPGTLDTVNIVMFADAMEDACRCMAAAAQKQSALSAQLLAGLREFRKPPCVFLSDESSCVPEILMISFPGYEGAVLKRILAAVHDVVVGTGSACSAEAGEPSHVLTAMGCDAATIRGALRISMSPGHTAPEDIEHFLKALQEALRSY